MTKYINKITGAVIDVTTPISGENWVLKSEHETETIVTDEGEETIEVSVESEEPEEFDLTKMKVAELKQYAKDNDIELPSDANKDEIIQVIAEAFQG